MFGEKIFISATAQPFTVMFSSDNFEGQHGKNQLNFFFLNYTRFLESVLFGAMKYIEG